MLGAIARGIGILLLLIGGAARSEDWIGWPSLRIDLSDADPILIDELPGILEDEVEALRAVAGPGTRDLAERLSRTGIPPDRLREWVPYMDLPLAGPGRSGWSTRAGAETRGTSDVRGRIDLRLAHPVVSGELAARITGNPASDGGAKGASVDGRGRVRLASSTFLWGGCLAGSSGGIDPWSDPLREGRALSASSPRAGITARSASRGLYLERGGLAVSGWREDGSRCGGLVALRSTAGAMWLGRREGDGGGGGTAIRIRKIGLTAALHKVNGVPPILRFGASDDAQRIRLATAWSLGERGDGRTVVVDGSITRTAGACRISLHSTLLGKSRSAPSRGRGGFGVAWRQGSASSVCEATWSGTQRKLRAEIGREIRPGLHFRLETRGRLAGPSREGSIDGSASASSPRFRCSAGFVLRTADVIPFPSYAGAGGAERVALHARGSLRRGSSRIDFVLVAPLSARESVRFGEPSCRIAIEQGAPQPR